MYNIHMLIANRSNTTSGSNFKRLLMLNTRLSVMCCTDVVPLASFSIVLGVCSMIPVMIYPLMKRVTYWPQVFLGTWRFSHSPTRLGVIIVLFVCYINYRHHLFVSKPLSDSCKYIFQI